MWYNNSLEKFAMSKMNEDTLSDYKDQECIILGDSEAFITYYYQLPNVVWVNFLYATNKRKMLKICKVLWAITQESNSIILFNCDEFERMFQGHAKKIYLWNKEI